MNSKLTGEGAAAADDDDAITIAIFNYKQRLLSIDMKTKVVQHVPRIKLDNFSGSQRLSGFQTYLVYTLYL